MSYHEAFWLATSAAAPVIALAAVVAVPDASAANEAARRSAMAYYRPKIKRMDPAVVDAGFDMLTAARRVSRLSVFNMLVQAGLLAVSLSALATTHEVMPSWIAIVLAVSGLLLLAWTLTRAAALRAGLEKFERQLLGKDAQDD